MELASLGEAAAISMVASSNLAFTYYSGTVCWQMPAVHWTSDRSQQSAVVVHASPT